MRGGRINYKTKLKYEDATRNNNKKCEDDKTQ